MVYIDPEDRYRRADCGAVVQIHPDHVARFDRLNRLQGQEPEPPDAEQEASPDSGGEVVAPRPRRKKG